MRVNRARPAKLLAALVCCLFSWSGCALAQQSDILWRNTSTGDTVIWFLNGGTFASSLDLGVVPDAWTVADIRDFNGDGYADILWRNTSTGDTVIWFLNEGGTFASSADLGVIPAAWTIAGTGYFGPTSGQQPPDVVVSDWGGNTAMGTGALPSNTPGYVHANPGGFANTASGYEALNSNTTGNWNTATGWSALAANTTSNSNTAVGTQALFVNTGSYNTALGAFTMWANTTASSNTAVGSGAMYVTTGNKNTALGANALYYNTTGSNNIAMGNESGFNLTTGSNNIDIGNPGVAGESGVIRIGTVTTSPVTQTAVYIAGIYGNTATSGLPVVINSNGLLGTTTSSERFKTAIAPMGSKTEKLSELRPVTFQYKADPEGTPRYGLIAEEVAKVYPELVVRDQDGRIDGVQYEELTPMLLNELQKQVAEAQQQAAQIRDLKQQVAELEELKVELRTALSKLLDANRLVADR